MAFKIKQWVVLEISKSLEKVKRKEGKEGGSKKRRKEGRKNQNERGEGVQAMSLIQSEKKKVVESVSTL